MKSVPFRNLILCGCLCAAVSVSAQQAPAPVEPATPETRRGREVLGLFLRNGLKQPYFAEEVTRNLRGKKRESLQIVKHAGPGRTRIEYLQPPALRGEILLFEGGRFLKYVPRRNVIMEAPAPVEDFRMFGRAMLQGVREGRITVRAVGTETVAGRSAAIVEVRSPHGIAPLKRLWIDEKTGVRLKIEDSNPQGQLISTSYYTKIDYNVSLDAKEFRAASLPDVPHEPLLNSQPLPNVQAAQQQVGYPIREPSLPAGYTLSGVWVDKNRSRATVILRYSDGVRAFTLFQRPLPQHSERFGPRSEATADNVTLRNGVARWRSGDRSYFLLGELKPEALKQIAESLR